REEYVSFDAIGRLGCGDGGVQRKNLCHRGVEGHAVGVVGTSGSQINWHSDWRLASSRRRRARCVRVIELPAKKGGRRHGCHVRQSRDETVHFVVEEKERLILDDRSADGETKLMADIGIHRPGVWS